MVDTGDVEARPIVVPLGLLCGSTASGSRLVRRGVELLELPEDQTLVWAASHGSAATILNDGAWDRDTMLDAAREAHAHDAEGVLGVLVDRGLVVEIPGSGPEAIAFARRHRVTPLLLGLGNSADDPSTFGIGVLGAPLIRIGFTEYDIWQFSAMDECLWDACRSAAVVVADRDDADRDGTDRDTAPAVDGFAHELLVRFLRVLPGLLLTGAAYVDTSFRLARPVRTRPDGQETAA